MKPLLERIRDDYPYVNFVEGSAFYWSPVTQQVFYKKGIRETNLDSATHAILHELSHALLRHRSYTTDFQLLQMELAAWEHAKRLATYYNFVIDENHVQDCLDSYRDWLYKRSICPTCSTKSIQCDEKNSYQCFNCQTYWKVTSSRFCRPYRHFKEKNRSPILSSTSDLF
jgi:NADH pyrophosphatase NudC (nudix superfamily)